MNYINNIEVYNGLINIFRRSCKKNDCGYCKIDKINPIICQWDTEKCMIHMDEKLHDKKNVKSILGTFRQVLRKEKIKKLLNENTD